MKSISFILEEDEIMLLRMQVRMMEIMIPESNEQIDSFIKKILDATGDANQDSRKEIAKMQRAMRRVKKTIEFSEFMDRFKIVERLLIKEMENEG